MRRCKQVAVRDKFGDLTEIAHQDAEASRRHIRPLPLAEGLQT